MNAVKAARAKLAEAHKAWAETPEWAKRAAKSWSEPLMDALSELDSELELLDRGIDAMHAGARTLRLDPVAPNGN